ncbi:MAG: tRNA-dihydrouridine synthase family protein [Puniceicoccales bacterium]|jgi:tRNA-dihydrouridine synthase|nr:tRNA-dihydrouridine synthase family protein [Puniceicoccales bacterium]
MNTTDKPPTPALPATALAPMQDVTTPEFMRIIAQKGAPDWFVTEFIRVHATSTPAPELLARLDNNGTGRPVYAQLIGENIPAMVRTASRLLRHRVAGIDLNLGCPAPKICRKHVGGGLLRDLAHVDALLGSLREVVPPGKFTVKARIGFDDASPLPSLVALVNKHAVDLLTLHARTVRERYHGPVHYDALAWAARALRCPLIANGDITTPECVARVAAATGCAGVMIGRHAVRNPWIFRQIREQSTPGATVFRPLLGDVRDYITELCTLTAPPGMSPVRVAAHMKKYLNFIGTQVDPQGAFLHAMRRAGDLAGLLRVCDAHLTRDGNADKPYAPEPYPGLRARPNCE